MVSPIYKQQIIHYFGKKYKSKEMYLLEKIIPENHKKVQIIGKIPQEMEKYSEKYKIKFYENDKKDGTYKIKHIKNQ
jgi:hypothetical protein